MPPSRLLPCLALALLACSAPVKESLREGDALCARAPGSEGGCQRVMSSDRFEQERQEIRENRRPSAP